MDAPIAVSPAIIHAQIIQMLSQSNSQNIKIEMLPPSLIEFMKSRNIDIEELLQPIPRYIRIKPTAIISKKQICKSLNISQAQIVQIDEFYALDPACKINKSDLYNNNLLYGMDISSAMPVKCLEIADGQIILQLCSSPGNKSMYMADHAKNLKIVGVEINENRANVMKSLIKRYGFQNVIDVKVADGVTFQSEEKFDRVLVDAECTHEGSLKHISKFINNTGNSHSDKKEKNLTKQQQKQYKKNNTNPYTSNIQKNNEWTIQDFQERFLDKFKLQNLQNLQLNLLQNGFKLLKEGGILVYSTCSYDQSQNEEIVSKFLKRNENANLVDCAKGLNTPIKWKHGSLQETLRFSPKVSLAGGMFVAKISKEKQSKI